MKKLILLIILLAVSILLGLQLAKDPGYVLLAYRQTSVEMPLWFFVLASVIFIFLLHVLSRLFGFFGVTRERWQARKRLRRYQYSLGQLQRAAQALMRGRWSAAERACKRAADVKEAQALAHIGAALAAQQQRAVSRRNTYLAAIKTLDDKQLQQLSDTLSAYLERTTGY